LNNNRFYYASILVDFGFVVASPVEFKWANSWISIFKESQEKHYEIANMKRSTDDAKIQENKFNYKQ